MSNGASSVSDTARRPAHTQDQLTLQQPCAYENAGDGFQHPVKKPKGSKLAERDKAFNAVIRGVHAVAEHANALVKVTFKALRRVSLGPSAITRTPEPPSSSCSWSMTAQP